MLLRDGTRNAEVSGKLSVPMGTVGKWKFIDRARHPAHYEPARRTSCFICEHSAVAEQPYAYLLGLYLGDGYLIHRGKLSRFEIYCANAWPGLMDAAESAMRQVMPGASISRVPREGCTAVTSRSKHWACTLPHHGPGMKHTRRISLLSWQQEIVAARSADFIRGLIHADGCRVTNWTRKTVRGEAKRYEYTRYLFVNESAEIRDLFTDALDRLNIAWTPNRRNCVSIARRDSVAHLDEFVGPKY